MQAQRCGTPRELDADSALERLGRLAPAFLGLVLLSRVTDAMTHPDFAYVPFVVAALVLPLWFATGFGRSVWARWHPALLGIQRVLSFAPLALFGAEWPGGAAGPLGGLLLLVLRAPVNWVLFLVAGAADLAVRYVVGLPPGPPHSTPSGSSSPTPTPAWPSTGWCA